MTNAKLTLRNARKKSKPNFVRDQSNIKPQFGTKWVKPRGMHNKTRRGMRGKMVLPTVGFRSPVEVRGLNRAGFREVVVANVDQLKKVDVKTEIAVLSAGLGMKRKVEILQKAVELKIPVSNVKDVQKFIDEAKKKVEERKKQSQDTKSKKEDKEKAAKEKAEKEAKKDQKKDEKKTESKTEVKSQ
jgi:large subunit ribosomal protein L32e